MCIDVTMTRHIQARHQTASEGSTFCSKYYDIQKSMKLINNHELRDNSTLS